MEQLIDLYFSFSGSPSPTAGKYGPNGWLHFLVLCNKLTSPSRQTHKKNMKKTIFLIGLGLMMCFSGCEKVFYDDDYTGGGDDGGGGGIVPTSVTVTKLVLNEFPAKPQGSNNWDFLDDPDVFFKIMDANQAMQYFKSSTKNNITNASLPTTYSVNYTIYDLDENYSFVFYDEDVIDDDELMGSKGWYPLTDMYRSDRDLYNSSCDLDFTIELTWNSSKGEPLYTKEARVVNGEVLSDDPEVRQVLNVE